ncbi:ABC transporter ATP-binding protein/permease [Mariniblastus sp.]|nr:ABC transporter ATP-binding protein/permease [Mariniblastus sp.]
MNQLGRALRMTLKYRWSLLGSFGCSLLVAILWGANLGAVYPFVEIVLQNKTLPQWADERIEESTTRIAKCEQRLDELQGAAVSKSSSNAGDSTVSTTALTSAAEASEIRAIKYDLKAEHSRLATTQYLQPIINRFAPNDAFRTLVYLMGVMFFATVVRCLCLFGNMVYVARVGHRTVLDLQQRAFENVLSLESHEAGSGGTSDLISRIRGETQMIGRTVTTLFGKTVREPLKMAACLTGAAYVNWRLLILSVLVCPLAGFVLAMLARATRRATKRAIEQSANLMDRLYEAISFQRVVKSFTMEDQERQRFKLVAQDIYRKRMRIASLDALSRNNNELLGISMITLSVLAGGYLALTQQTHLLGLRMAAQPMDFGSVMVFFGFLIGVADPLRKLGGVYAVVQQGVVASNRVFPLIDKRAAVTEPASPRPMPTGKQGLTVSLENTWFEYQPDAPVLKGISLSFPAGSSTAIVGHNGCGKSTLINLVPRFFDPAGNDGDCGTVSINGQDVRGFSIGDLRRSVGYVTQQTMLFNDTVANNIAYGSPDATLEDIVAAAKQAHANDFISVLECGYDTMIGQSGRSLSGGQRQRISLARAILKNPQVLILDEATSQIDPESENLIHQTLREFIRNRTTIMISHRVSTLDLVDQIVIMKDGKIVDSGSHSQLISRCREYQKMRNGYLEGVA